MHVSLLATCFAASANMPSLSTLAVTALIVAFCMAVGSWVLNRSRSAVKPSERVLTNETDDKGVPVFFDLDSYKSEGNGPARPAACRTPAPRRRDLF